MMVVKYGWVTPRKRELTMTRKLRPGSGVRARASNAAVMLGILGLAQGCSQGDAEDLVAGSAALSEATAVSAPYVPYLGEHSGLFLAYRALRDQPAPLAAAAGQTSDTLAEYAAKCDAATGIHVPSFNCDIGTEPLGQGTTPRGPFCAQPNVLNGVCDPGSRFQVLAQSAEAVVVGHCRKDGLRAIEDPGLYNDIAVIQHNKMNGATCFYQALGYADSNHVPTPLHGESVAAPSLGLGVWSWMTPKDTERIGCTACHTNGALVRSEYLAQTAILPNTSTGYGNKTGRLSFVGADYTLNRTWSMTAPAGDGGKACNSCHLMAVSNSLGFGLVHGSGGELALIATRASQASKFPHGNPTVTNPNFSPIWMRPFQVSYDPGAQNSAQKFMDCAVGFWGNRKPGFPDVSVVPGCTFMTLAGPWAGFTPSQLVTTTTATLL